MTTLTAPIIDTAPEPGIYRDVSFEVYSQWPYLNNSGAGHLLRSPAHYQAYRDGIDDDSKSKARGTICHAGVLELSRFETEYAIGPDVKLNTKAGKDAWEAFCAAHPGKFHVRGADGEAMLGVREAVWSHPTARELLAADGPCELSIVWDDRETGVRCKSRIDKLIRSKALVADLKTTRDARADAFANSIGDYGYHRQAAFNLHGLAALGEFCDGMALIAVEPEPPYALAVYVIDDEDLENGREEMVEACKIYRDCGRRGAWPGYDPNPRVVRVPDWKTRRANERRQMAARETV